MLHQLRIYTYVRISAYHDPTPSFVFILRLFHQVQDFQYKNFYSDISNIQCSMHDLSRCVVSVSRFARKQKHLSLSLQGTEVYEVKSLYFTQQLFVFSSIILSLLEMRIAVKI